jgi:hypothetical protein
MKSKFENRGMRIHLALLYPVIFALATCAVSSNAAQIAGDQRAKVKGTIASRNGDLVTVNDKKAATKTVVDVTDNQKLSEDRAESVAKYLRDTQNVPMRRILVPAGYGATHPDAANSDPQGRALNRRVEVKVLVNKGLNEGT